MARWLYGYNEPTRSGQWVAYILEDSEADSIARAISSGRGLTWTIFVVNAANNQTLGSWCNGSKGSVSVAGDNSLGEDETLWANELEDEIDPQPRSYISANGLLAYTKPWTQGGIESGNVIGAVAKKDYYRIRYANYFVEPIQEGWSSYKKQTLAEAKKRLKSLVPAGSIWMGFLERFVSEEGWVEV